MSTKINLSASKVITPATKSKDTSSRAQAIFAERYQKMAAKIDITFCYVLFFQWILAVVLAQKISPQLWNGTTSELHPHVYLAALIGGLLFGGALLFVRFAPGQAVTRNVIASVQILFSVLLIHVTEGRIETHFHVFGSLAFLAFYRDVRPIAIATLITAVDHFVRGAFFPESVYGVLFASPWRAVEHAAWVLFEDVILIASIRIALSELNQISESQAQIEYTLSNVEKIVEDRTNELRVSQKESEQHQAKLVTAAKLSSLGEMAAGIAHEINNPVSIIHAKSTQLRRWTKSNKVTQDQMIKSLEVIERTALRITKIVDGLRNFARDGKSEMSTELLVSKIIADASGLCEERLKSHGIALEISLPEDFLFCCKVTQIEQILVNLINNSFDAIVECEDPWIRIEVKKDHENVKFILTDSGNGIPENVVEKMMNPFFTTKPIGKGTGLGLSISHGIARDHGGELTLNRASKNTQFVLTLPLKGPALTIAS